MSRADFEIWNKHATSACPSTVPLVLFLRHVFLLVEVFPTLSFVRIIGKVSKENSPAKRYLRRLSQGIAPNLKTWDATDHRAGQQGTAPGRQFVGVASPPISGTMQRKPCTASTCVPSLTSSIDTRKTVFCHRLSRSSSPDFHSRKSHGSHRSNSSPDVP